MDLLVSKKRKMKIYELIDPLGDLGGLGGIAIFFVIIFENGVLGLV